MSEIATSTGQVKPGAVVFKTYLEARQEATRRLAGDAASGLMSKVVRLPYGGYAIRSWPVELLAEPEIQLAYGRDDRPVYGE